MMSWYESYRDKSAAGLALVADAVNGVDRWPPDFAELVRMILKLAEEDVTWCYTEADGSIRAMESGVVRSFLIVCVDPITALGASPVESKIDTTPSRVLITTDRLSTVWLGVRLIRELVWVAGHAGRQLPMWSSAEEYSNEVMAYRLEMYIVDILTRGSLLASLGGHARRTTSSFELSAAELQGRVGRLLETLDMGPAETEVELRERAAALALAVLLDHRGSLQELSCGPRDVRDLERLVRLPGGVPGRKPSAER